MISCSCIYEVNGMNYFTLEEDHPEVYNEGATEEMYAKWDAEWGSKRLRWTGEWPGKRECRALGYYCRDLWKDTGEVMPRAEDFDEIRRRGVRWHVPCGPDDEGAHEDLNRWARQGCPEVP